MGIPSFFGGVWAREFRAWPLPGARRGLAGASSHPRRKRRSQGLLELAAGAPARTSDSRRAPWLISAGFSGYLPEQSAERAILKARSPISPPKSELYGTVWNRLGSDRRKTAIWVPPVKFYGAKDNLASSPENRFSVRLFRTAIAIAFFWPTSTTSRLPLVTPV